MPLFLLDSNVYITAIRDAAFGEALCEFHDAHLPRTVMSAVVAAELLVGAQRPDIERRLSRTFVEPYQQRKRFLTPAWSAWTMAIEVDRRIRARSAHKERLARRSFFHDILIAATAREIGATIITLNRTDFSTIAGHLDVKVIDPWPKAA